MSKFILSNSTVHQIEFLIIGDNKILSKPSNLKKISQGNKNLINNTDIKNTKLVSIYSTNGANMGGFMCGIYLEAKEKNNPKNFYCVPFNSLKHKKIDDLIKKIENEGKKLSGEVKITTGKICFNAILDTGYKHIRLKNQKTFKNEFNNSFKYEVENGIYEFYSYTYEYKGSDVENYDEMFSVKKKV